MATEEEWASSPLRSDLSSFRDYLEDEEENDDDYNLVQQQDTGDSSLLALESYETGDQSSTNNPYHHEDHRPGEHHEHAHDNPPLAKKSTGGDSLDPPPRLSPFSPELRRRNRRQHKITEGLSRSQSASSYVHWGDTEEEIIPLSPDFALSLGDDRIVSVLIQVQQPPPKTTLEEQEGRLPCVFPTAAFSKHNNSNNETNFPLASPTSIAMTAADATRKIMIVNPCAFGKHVPNEVSMEVLGRIVGHSMSSEDWAREFRFNQVLWPSGTFAGFFRVAQAIAEDLTAPASIAQRSVFSYGQEDKRFMLFGKCISESVAQSFAHAAPNNAFPETLGELENTHERFGLIGLTLYHLLRFKHEQETMNGPHKITIGLALMEITGEEKFVDLTEKRPQERTTNGQRGASEPSLKLIYNGDNTGGILSGQKIHEIASLKELGHFMRRAFKVAERRGRKTKRGHMIATLYIYRSEHEFGKTVKVPVGHFVDLGTPTSINLSEEDAPKNKDIISAQTRRNAAIRKSATALGAVLRGCLLRDAGNSVSLAFRESLLTKVLQRSIDHQDARVVMLTSVSPMKDEYEKTMEYLRFANRLLEKPGEPLKSPFDALTKTATGTNATSPTSISSDRSEHISLSDIDEKHHKFLLQTLTSDARQRLSKAGIHGHHTAQNVMYVSPKRSDMTGSFDVETDYQEIDPSDFDDQNHGRPHRLDADLQATLSTSKTPLARNLSKGLSERLHHARPDGLDTSYAMESTEEGSAFPSPITTDTGIPSTEYSDASRKLMEKKRATSARRTRNPMEPGGNQSPGPQRKSKREFYDMAPQSSSKSKSSVKGGLESRPISRPDPIAPPSTGRSKIDKSIALRATSAAFQPPEDVEVGGRETPINIEEFESKESVFRSYNSPPPSGLINVPADLGGRETPINVEGDDTDNNTVSEIRSIDEAYGRLKQNSAQNADSIGTYLKALQDSEQSIISRLSAERDTLRLKCKSLEQERIDDATRRDKDRDVTRHRLDKLVQERNELEKIAEEAIEGREELVGRVHQLQSRLQQTDSGRVSSRELQSLEMENRHLSGSLKEVNNELHYQKAESAKQTAQIRELMARIQTLEQEKDQWAQTRVQDAERIAELEDELRQTKDDNEFLRANVSDSVEEVEKARASLESREAELNKKLVDTEAELDSTREELSDLADTMKSILEEKKLKQSESSRMDQSMKKLEETIDFLETERSSLTEKVQSIKGENEMLEEELRARAKDVTELAAAAEELKLAKDELDARLLDESEAKAKAQSTAESLIEALQKVKEETRRRLDPLVEHRRQEQELHRHLMEENDELRLRNERLEVRVERLLEEQRRIHDGPPEHERLIYGNTQIAEPISSFSDLSRERLEDLALNLSLIVRNFPDDGDSQSNDLSGLELQIRNTEHITDLLLKTLRQRVLEIRRLKSRRSIRH